MGGRKNRHRVAELVVPLPLKSESVREILAQAILDVRSNALTPRSASALAQLSNSLLRAIQVTELEERLAKLERAVEENPAASAQADEMANDMKQGSGAG
jgi:hypothetical protein